MALSRGTEQCVGIPHCSKINSANKKGKGILRFFPGECCGCALVWGPGVVLCSGYSCVHCRVSWDAGASVDPSSKGLGSLSSPHRFSFLCAKKMRSVKWSVARCGDSMLGNKRYISVAVWEEAVC